ncbi:unnamed protein product [Fusarium venenatum]|uniref:Uncharacterized protein n=1 Tax=Fusarium venenatum TaxID=56646 RepID=A0A2L2SR37_9HYPO|nr:uncharacterized protein FVRRES_13347 [Fusarium venenatum]CEI40940.1 unnamed protein product [Fusarium venenatum]
MPGPFCHDISNAQRWHATECSSYRLGKQLVNICNEEKMLEQWQRYAKRNSLSTGDPENSGFSNMQLQNQHNVGRRKGRNSRLKAGKGLNQPISKIIKLRITFSNVHKASLFAGSVSQFIVNVQPNKPPSSRPITHIESFDTYVPHYECPDICRAAIDYGMIGDLNTFGPTSTVTVIEVARFIVTKCNGASWKKRFGRHVRNRPLMSTAQYGGEVTGDSGDDVERCRGLLSLSRDVRGVSNASVEMVCVSTLPGSEAREPKFPPPGAWSIAVAIQPYDN